MGTYATTTTLDTLMIGVNFDTATTALASALITHAENEVNKYLSRRYDLSQSSFQTTTGIPPLVRSLAETLAEGYSWQRLSRGSKESMARGKTMIDMATENLKAIAAYQVDLVNTAGALITDMSNTAYRVLSNTKSYTSTFDEDDELAWAVDADKLQDISDARD